VQDVRGHIVWLSQQKVEGDCLGEDYLPYMEVTSFIDDGYFQMFSYDITLHVKSTVHQINKRSVLRISP